MGSELLKKRRTFSCCSEVREQIMARFSECFLADVRNHASLTQMTGAPPMNPQFNSLVLFDAYQWKALGSKQVVYKVSDTGLGHVHELFVQVGGSWNHQNLTEASGILSVPLANQSTLCGFGWDEGRSKQVVFLTADGHVREMFTPLGGSWDHADLTEKANNAPTASESVGRFSCFEWSVGNTKQVVYLRTDGHIHELFVPVGGSWGHADLTDLTKAAGAPPASLNCQIVGYQWRAGDAKQVVYRTDDGHIDELFVSVGGSWGHADLNQLVTDAPPASTNSVTLAAYDWADSKQIVYLTDEGHIHELSIKPGDSRHHADLTKTTSSPPAV